MIFLQLLVVGNFENCVDLLRKYQVNVGLILIWENHLWTFMYRKLWLGSNLYLRDNILLYTKFLISTIIISVNKINYLKL